MALTKDVMTIQRKYKIIGRKEIITQCLAADNANKHLLIEGQVGVGKTTIASAIADFLGRTFFRVDGDERYTSARLVGWFDPPVVLKDGYTRDTFIHGPLTETMENGGVLFINELNRMPEATQNTLLPVMDEGRLHVPKLGAINAKSGFMYHSVQIRVLFVIPDRNKTHSPRYAETKAARFRPSVRAIRNFNSMSCQAQAQRKRTRPTRPNSNPILR